jgi:hypothetical protein
MKVNDNWNISCNNLWSSLLNCFAGIVFESFEVLVEHLRDFIQVSLVFGFVGPRVFGVQDARINALDGFGEAEVEDGKSIEFSLSEAAVMNSVNDISGGFNADTLNKIKYTFPIPYFPPIHPVLTNQTLTLCW